MGEKFAGLTPKQIKKIAAQPGPYKVGDRVVINVDDSITAKGLQGRARRQAQDCDGRIATIVDVGNPADIGDSGGPFPPYWVQLEPIEPGQKPEGCDIAWYHHELSPAPPAR